MMLLWIKNKKRKEGKRKKKQKNELKKSLNKKGECTEGYCSPRCLSKMQRGVKNVERWPHFSFASHISIGSVDA